MPNVQLLADRPPGSLPEGTTAPALAGWARDRGLDHRAGGLLAPLTPRLRRGLGVGTRKAYRAEPGSRWSTIFDRDEKRPERGSHDICRGTLPGGLEGLLAHHTHLVEHSDEDGCRWEAVTATVVVADLRDAARAVGTVSAGARTPMRALAGVGRRRASSDPTRTMVEPPATREVRDGRTWTLTPAEDATTLELLAGGSSRALAEAPGGVEVEIEYGVLCVWVGRELTDAAELDALCRAASAVALGARAVAVRNPPLAAEYPAVAPAPTDRRRWIEAGVATVEWPAPPADVPEAVAAYERVVRGRARRVGGLIALALLVLALAGSAAAIWIGLKTGMAAGGAITGIFAAVLFAGIVRSVSRAGREIARDEIDARARPWGFEAFVRGYAATRGMTREDPDAVRRRLVSPLRGRALAALHGRLGGCVDGHLLIWLEPGAGTPARQWLLAVVAAPGRVPAPPAPFQAQVSGDMLVVGVPVDERDRSAAALDRLAAVAGSLATSTDPAIEAIGAAR